MKRIATITTLAILPALLALLVPSIAAAQTGCTVKVDSGRIIVSGCVVVTATPTSIATGIVNFDTMTSSLVCMQVMQIGTAFYLQGLTAAATTMSTLTHAAFANTTTIRFTVSYFI